LEGEVSKAKVGATEIIDEDPEYFTVMCRVTSQMMGAFEELRDSGFYGNGQDIPSVVDELLREALRRAMVERCNGAQ
jgi:hypothetical protein